MFDWQVAPLDPANPAATDGRVDLARRGFHYLASHMRESPTMHARYKRPRDIRAPARMTAGIHVQTSSRARKSSTRALLLMSCSKSKRTDPGPAAIVYDGPGFRSLRKAQRAGADLDVYIVSAKHGLLEHRETITPYDVRLASTLDASFVESLRRDMRKRIEWSKYGDVFTFLGPNYERAVGDVSELIEPNAQLTRAAGPIGERLHALRIWLESIQGARTA